MLGVSGLLGNSGDGAASAEAPDGGGGEVGAAAAGSNTDEYYNKSSSRIVHEEGDQSSGGGNRWPRQETLALLKIRSDMDVAFREATLKAPLWDEVCRKLAELGYNRSSKKCKEKFENVYKYHKRTKDGRSTKPDSKTYRFFDQLQALDSHPPPPPSLPLLLPPPPAQPPPPPPPAMPATNPPPPAMAASPAQVTVSLPTKNSPQFTQTQANPINPFPQPLPPPPPPPVTTTNVAPLNTSGDDPVNQMLNSPTSSSSTSSDEEPERRGKRKRKWEYFFQRLMKEVIDKQEEMQKNFLEALEKRERDRMAREEAWRAQEMARMNREHDRLVQERSSAANKDAAVISFLQQVSEQKIPFQIPNPNPQIQNQIQIQLPLENNQIPISLPPPPTTTATALTLTQLTPPPPAPSLERNLGKPKSDNGSSSRWPKSEVHALIQLRTDLDIKYQDNGPKGPLWEEISSEMRKIGYNRSAKRCKEKWENINKYFKKVKESNKKRPEDSKTCPYFHQLDALYRDRNFKGEGLKNEMSNPMVPIMVRPEQQWPNPQDPPLDEHENEDEEDDEDDEDDGGGFELVANKPSSVATIE